jgi:predicted lipoprotein with Yx(FWY)xxD motif
MRKLLIVLGALLAPVMIAVTFADNTPLMVDGNDQLGKFLTDRKGMTFYLFRKDTPGVRNRYDACAQACPPLVNTGSATLPADATCPVPSPPRATRGGISPRAAACACSGPGRPSSGR